MQRTIAACILLSCLTVHGQELVRNGGFEDHRRCPKSFHDKPAKGLRQVKSVRGMPGFFHACSATMGVPDNWAGNRHAYEGEGYAGLVLTAHGGNECNSREFIQLALDAPLENGRKYTLRFRVSLAQRSGYTTDRVGACFSTTDRSGKRGVSDLIGKAHVDKPPEQFLTDSAGWMLVEGRYAASGGERFLVIGNFQECQRTSRKAITPNVGEGVLQNMQDRNRLDLDPDKQRSLRRRLLATQAYAYIDGVSLTLADGFPAPMASTPEQACPEELRSPPRGTELLADPSFTRNQPSHGAAWSNASGGTPDLMDGTTGIYLHSAVNEDHREFIRTDLLEALDPCMTYRVGIRLRRNTAYGYAVDRIGVALVDSSTMDRRRGLLSMDPVWTTPVGYVLDPDGLGLQLCGEFQAPGCSRTLFVGNFIADSSTTILRTDPLGGPYAYYFLQEVSLRPLHRVEGCTKTCEELLITLPPDTLTDTSAWPEMPWNIRFEVADHLPKEGLNEVGPTLHRLLSDNLELRLIISGHTDDTGSPGANLDLSRRRAEAVHAALLALGISTSRMEVRYHGDAMPVGDNSTEDGRRLNRRVELTLDQGE